MGVQNHIILNMHLPRNHCFYTFTKLFILFYTFLYFAQGFSQLHLPDMRGSLLKLYNIMVRRQMNESTEESCMYNCFFDSLFNPLACKSILKTIPFHSKMIYVMDERTHSSRPPPLDHGSLLQGRIVLNSGQQCSIVLNSVLNSVQQWSIVF